MHTGSLTMLRKKLIVWTRSLKEGRGRAIFYEIVCGPVLHKTDAALRVIIIPSRNSTGSVYTRLFQYFL
jgi:hypothetical protein